jgi:plasminogen activator inhibitor 1 RNA-binding protein
VVVEEEGVVVIAVEEGVVVLLTDIARQARRSYFYSWFIIPVQLNRSSSDSDKKIHQGWGGDEGGDELKAEEAGTTDAQAEGVAAAADGWDSVPIDPWSQPAPADPWAIPPPGDEPVAPAAEEEKGDDDRKPRERDPEDEENTISYDQYLVQMKENTTSSVPKLEGVREANEGADDAWGDVVEHKKNEDDEAYYVGKVWWVRYQWSRN